MRSRVTLAFKLLHTEWRQSRAFDCLLILLLTIAIRIPFTIATSDDAYITFRYARNLANGFGFVYNAGEHVLGTTTPLFTLFLAAVGRLGLDIVLIGKSVNVLAEAATAVLIYTILREIGSRGLAWGGAILFIISTYNIYSAAEGMETGLFTFSVMLTLFLYSRERWTGMGMSAGLHTLLRPDGLLVITAIGLDWVLQKRNFRYAIKPSALFTAVLLPWVLFATWYFGSPIPNSITAKAITYRSATIWDWPYAFLQIFLTRGGWLGVMLIAVFLLAGIFSLRTVESRGRLLPYLIWFLLYLAVFTLARAGPFNWYYSPLMPVLYLFLALGGFAIYQKALTIPMLERTFILVRTRTVAILVVSALTLTIGLSLYASWEYVLFDVEFERQVTLPIGLWLRDNTPVNSVVAVESIGQVGWHSNRYILDEGGLVSKQALALNMLTPGNINFIGILQTHRPDYLVAWQTYELPLLMATPEGRSWFGGNYIELGRYSGGGKTWILFKRRD